MVRALMPLAEGVEESEAVVTVDVLRRAQWEVVTASLGDTLVACSRGVRIVADTTWDAVRPEDFDVLVLPGGAGGTRRLAGDARVLEAVRAFHAAGRMVAAICAAPLVLQFAGVLAGRSYTCHPAVRDQFTAGTYRDEAVVADGSLVTSQGAGTVFDFALTLVALKGGDAQRRVVAQGLALRIESTDP